MIELDAILNATTNIEVDFFGHKINCEVRLNAITTDFLKEIQTDSEFGFRLLERSLVKWDIAVKGKILPVSVDNIRKLPVGLADALGEAIIDKRDELKKPKSPETPTS